MLSIILRDTRSSVKDWPLFQLSHADDPLPSLWWSHYEVNPIDSDENQNPKSGDPP